MKMEKVTKRERYEEIRKILEEKGAVELVEFVNHELELLAKKNAKRTNKPTKSANLTAKLSVRVLEVMEPDQQYTATELVKLIGDPEISNQRMTASLNALMVGNYVKNEKVKGKSLFSLI